MAKNYANTTLLVTMMLALYMIVQPVQGMYYRAFPDKWQCFKDIISTNYVSDSSNDCRILWHVYIFCGTDTWNGSLYRRQWASSIDYGRKQEAEAEQKEAQLGCQNALERTASRKQRALPWRSTPQRAIWIWSIRWWSVHFVRNADRESLLGWIPQSADSSKILVWVP